jgi:hypothetical protein
MQSDIAEVLGVELEERIVVQEEWIVAQAVEDARGMEQGGWCLVRSTSACDLVFPFCSKVAGLRTMSGMYVLDKRTVVPLNLQEVCEVAG